VRSASITYIIRHYVARMAHVIEDYPHNADARTLIKRKPSARLHEAGRLHYEDKDVTLVHHQGLE
jgi:hypothetical protein